MGLKGVAQKGKGISDKGKGKAVAGNSSSGAKRKRDDENENSGSGCRRRNDRGVLRFFDDAADEANGSDESDFGNGTNGTPPLSCDCMFRKENGGYRKFAVATMGLRLWALTVVKLVTTGLRWWTTTVVGCDNGDGIGDGGTATEMVVCDGGLRRWWAAIMVIGLATAGLRWR